MSNIKSNKATRQNRLRQIQSGIDKHFANVTAITLAGVTHTPADLKKLIQSDIDASDASVQARAAARVEVQAERDSHAKVDPILRLFKAFVIAQFGDTIDATAALADFGYTPRKAAKPKTAVKAEAQVKAKATRVARGTKGPKAKAKIKGTVPATAEAGSAPAPVAATGGTPAVKPTA